MISEIYLRAKNSLMLGLLLEKRPISKLFMLIRKFSSKITIFCCKTLKYIYNGEIFLDEHGVPAILELLMTADELILENFFDPIEDYLIEYHAKELEKIFVIFYRNSAEIAAKTPPIVFNSQDFISLSENTLFSILNWDDLNIEESEIWEKIVEWGVAKLESNIQMKKVLYWTDENFNAFKESIERLLPLIRFFNISSVDFYHKVKPFVKILPGTLNEDLLHYYLIPDSQQKSVNIRPLRSNIDLKLLQSHNIKQLDNWIQGKDENIRSEYQVRNDFKLLLRGSRDGFTPANFHQLCDNKGATVSVIKVKGTGQLIGGYNLQSWHSGYDIKDETGSFIFSLGDGKAEKAKLNKFVGSCGPFSGSNHGTLFWG
ncbi:hypothetical protein G9A89_007834 [Geosiphon pyriformis]|nr:hypothetical protein G9A89_007834 [Geosiphon pyriformis]